MRPSTTRRTLVFVVCLAGVAALYWVPTAVRSPQRLGSPAAPPTPSVRSYEPSPTPTATLTTLPTAADTTPLDDDGPPPEPPADPATADPTGSPTAPPTSAPPRSDPSSSAATAPPASVSVSVSPSTEPSPTATETAEAPGRVHNLHLVESDHEGLVVAWNPVRDATAYQIVLNGYPVGGTTGTAVALRWFNDDMSQHYVQVRAIGPDGQPSGDAAYLPVTRPVDPAPEPSPTPTASATTAGEQPTPSPSATR